MAASKAALQAWILILLQTKQKKIIIHQIEKKTEPYMLYA